MNKLKRVGLTALAGSLVATSVYAGSLDVTGSWGIDYDSKDSDETTGGAFSMGDSVTFTGSGETDWGHAFTVVYELDGGTYDDMYMTYDMGDSGKITFGGSSKAGSGINSISEIVPSAEDDAYDYTGDATAYGVVGGSTGTDNIGYDVTFGDFAVSLENEKIANGSDRSIGLKWTGVDGLTVVAGMEEYDTADANGGSEGDTVGIKYATGGFTFGYQISNVDNLGSGEVDYDGTHMGATFAINDNMSVGYNRQKADISNKDNDEVNSAITASYTSGSMTVKGYAAKTEDVGGTATNDDEGKGVGVSFSF